MIDFTLEDVPLEDDMDHKILKLLPLADEEVNIIDPIVAPTSGLRIQILEKVGDEGSSEYLLPRRKLYLFLRVSRNIKGKINKL